MRYPHYWFMMATKWNLTKAWCRFSVLTTSWHVFFSLEEGKLYSRLQTLREEGDYNCYIQADADIELMIEPARRFVDHIGKYIGII